MRTSSGWCAGPTAYGTATGKRMGLSAENLKLRAPGLPAMALGREAWVRMVQGVLEAFPDGNAEVLRALGDENWGCIEARFADTHTGPLRGPAGDIEPTNRPVEFDYCMVARFEDGVAAELNEYYDQLGL